MNEQPLPWLVGAASMEITPPLQVGTLMSSRERRWEPFEGVRLPLHAHAVVIESGSRRVAIVSLDLLGLASDAVGGMQRFKADVVSAAGGRVSAEELILAATHTHSAPESLALTDLFQRACFQSWIAELAQKIGLAVRKAADSKCRCQLAVGSVQEPGLAVYRRLRTSRGVVFTHLKEPTDVIVFPPGPVDDWVRVAAFVAANERLHAVLVNATCHPVHEMCHRRISPDYPGEMSIALQQRHPGVVVLYLNGAAGNINPPTVSGGVGDARQHGRRLAEAADRALGVLQPVAGAELMIGRRSLQLPARRPDGQSAEQPLVANIVALRLGNAAWLFLPGEPFVETALAIGAMSPWNFTTVVGYAEDYLGYIPTDQAFEEGGYEIGPGQWSQAACGSEPLVRKEAIDLLRSLAREHC